MTPDEFMRRFEALFGSARYQEALDFAASALAEVRPPLPSEERERMHSMGEVAVNIVELEQAKGGSAASLLSVMRPEPDR